MHRNTLTYRLQRIRQISGHDLSDPGTCFNLQPATRALSTLGVLRCDEGGYRTCPMPVPRSRRP